MKELLLDHIFPTTDGIDDGFIIKESWQLNKQFEFEKTIFKNIGICRIKDRFSKAVVKIQDVKCSKKAMKAVANELRIIRQCHHPHIIKHLAVYTEGSIVMQFFPFYKQGDLLFKQQTTTLEDIQIRRITYELLLAIEYLHKLHIVHADIKLENVICTNDSFLFDVKLIDFGNSAIIGNNKKNRLMGTFGYMAPEVMSDAKQSYPVDLWSLAVLIYALKTKQLPFGDNEEKWKYKKRVMKCQLEYDRSFFDKKSEIKKFLKSIFIFEPDKRMTATECLAHPWINPTFDKLKFC